MTYGYSARIINEINEANPELLGVRLGRLCVTKNISVVDASRHFKVSTQTVYNWFRGLSSPSRETLILKIEDFITRTT